MGLGKKTKKISRLVSLAIFFGLLKLCCNSTTGYMLKAKAVNSGWRNLGLAVGMELGRRKTVSHDFYG